VAVSREHRRAKTDRLGIRGFNPKLKKAADRLEGLRTAEGEPIPRNTLAELRRDMDRRRLVRDQIQQIEHADVAPGRSLRRCGIPSGYRGTCTVMALPAVCVLVTRSPLSA
jgi:hypothetical protein